MSPRSLGPCPISSLWSGWLQASLLHFAAHPAAGEGEEGVPARVCLAFPQQSMQLGPARLQESTGRKGTTSAHHHREGGSCIQVAHLCYCVCEPYTLGRILKIWLAVKFATTSHGRIILPMKMCACHFKRLKWTVVGRAIPCTLPGWKLTVGSRVGGAPGQLPSEARFRY